jgi:hypothetical protein
MGRPYDWQDDGGTARPADPHGTINIYGNGGAQIGSGNTQHNNVYGPASPESAASPAAPARPAAGSPGGPPASTLYAYADIVGYSRFNARLQEESQDRLVRILDASLTEAGLRPEAVTGQNQGDARLLRFPAAADVGRVLAVMPRHLQGELAARNEFMAPQARLRVRLAYAMGISVEGRAGLVGNAPIAVVRLANASTFRQAMGAVPRADSGVILDTYLYDQYVRQDFRPDMGAAEYIPVRVHDPAKAFTADAWLRLPGCPPDELSALVG